MTTTDRTAGRNYRRDARARHFAPPYAIARKAHGSAQVGPGARELARLSRLPESRGLRLRVTGVSLALVALVALLLTSSPPVTATLAIVLVMGLFASTLVALVEWRTRDDGAGATDREPSAASGAARAGRRRTDTH